MSKPEKWIWTFAALGFVIGILTQDQTLEIQLHDTYFIVGYQNVSMISILLLATSGVIQLVVRKTGLALISRLTHLHLWLVLSGVAVIMSIVFLTGAFGPGKNVSMDLEISYTFIVLLITGVIGVLLGLVIMFVNIIFALLKLK